MMDLMTRQAEQEYENVIMGVARYQKNREARGESETQPGKYQIRMILSALAVRTRSPRLVEASLDRDGHKSARSRLYRRGCVGVTYIEIEIGALGRVFHISLRGKQYDDVKDG